MRCEETQVKLDLTFLSSREIELDSEFREQILFSLVGLSSDQRSGFCFFELHRFDVNMYIKFELN